jgi:hypothetical protein
MYEVYTKVSFLRYAVSQTIRINIYSENDLLFLLPLCNDLWFIVLRALLRQYKYFQIIRITMSCRSSDPCRKFIFIQKSYHYVPINFFSSFVCDMKWESISRQL